MLVELPFHAQHWQELDLFQSRNVPTKPQSTKKAVRCLENIGVPFPGQPKEFVKKLTALEKELGTCYATLFGLLTASGIRNYQDLAEELERFEDIATRLRVRKVFHPQELADTLGPFLVFSHTADFLQAMKTLESNVTSPQPQSIGNCSIGAAIFSLYVLLSESLAGEARQVGKIHSFSYITTADGKYVFHTFPLPPFYEINPSETNRSSLLRTSAFTFIASLLAVQLRDFHCFNTRKGILNNQEFTTFKGLMTLVKLIELINPFSYLLYYHQGRIMDDRTDYLKKRERDYSFVDVYSGAQYLLDNIKVSSNGVPLLPN
jgi:hypothetical protein